MTKPLVLVVHWLPDGELARLRQDFPNVEFVDTKPSLAEADIVYGLPDIDRLGEATRLRWIQLASAGVPAPLCVKATERKLQITNLAGLYGPTIAEHALAMMLLLSRNLHVVQENQRQRRWDRSVAGTMRDLHGKTLAVVGAGNIGQNIARLGKAFGMRVLGCRRRPAPTAHIDQIYGPGELRTMLAQADYVAVAAPLVRDTDGMLGEAEFQSMRPGSIYINVSRGGIAQEKALVDALRSGHLAAAGLDVYAVEPLAEDHPLWSLANVLVSPHFSGETVNTGSLPVQRFRRNLRNWLQDKPLEGQVDLALGY